MRIEYNTTQCDKRNSYRRKIREETKGKDGDRPDSNGDEAGASAGTLNTEDGTGGIGTGMGISQHGDGDREPAAKKMRRSPGAEDDDGEDDDIDADDPQDDDIQDEDMDEPEEDEPEEDDEQPEVPEEKEDPLEERISLHEEDEAVEEAEESD
jgi:DNA polymerase epsilon subunit 3